MWLMRRLKDQGRGKERTKKRVHLPMYIPLERSNKRRKLNPSEKSEKAMKDYERREQMMEMQRFLSASNVVVESFKLLKELQDDELEKYRKMMLCTLEKGLTIIKGDGYMKKMYDMAKTYGLIDLYITHIPKNIAEYYYKNLTFNASHEEVTSKVKTHEKRKRYAGSMSSEVLVAWMTLKDFLHFPRNRSASFFASPADVPMSVGSPATSAANVPDEELEMVVVASVANNVVGAKVVPPSAGRRWRGVVVRPVGSPWRVIAPSSDVDSKGKRVAFSNSASSPSFKKRKHVVLDEGPSSPKSVPNIAPSDEAYKTLFGSLASTEDPGDSDPFLLGIEEARSSRDALCNLSYPDV
ncbi:hypothetical protein Tco_0086486 [Tanacetum coccineum]